MPFWQRLVFTLIIIVITSFISGLVWHRLFGFSLPSYVGGVIGGLVAVPFWEFLKRKGSQKKSGPFLNLSISYRFVTGDDHNFTTRALYPGSGCAEIDF